MGPGVEPMSQTQSQTPRIYTREDLEEILRVLNERVKHLAELLERAEKSIREIHYILYYKTKVDIKIVDELAEIGLRLKNLIYDAIDELVISELRLDPDIEKYEKQYNVKFPYVSEHHLGVVLLKENETVKPVVVWTTYREVDYYEGEKNE